MDDSWRQYSAAEMERMMKVHDVLLKAMAKKISWLAAAVPKVPGYSNVRADCSTSIRGGFGNIFAISLQQAHGTVGPFGF